MAATESRTLMTHAERPLVIPSHVLAAVDQLEPAEQAQFYAALRTLQDQQTGRGATMELLDEPSALYLLHAAPQVRVFVRLPPDGAIEVEDIVRPGTLRRFGRQAAAPGSE